MIYLDHLCKATNAVLLTTGKQNHFDAFSHDSRQLIPGELFVAVRGERGDGHDYLLDAVRRGASGLLLEQHYFDALSEEVQATLLEAQCCNHRCRRYTPCLTTIRTLHTRFVAPNSNCCDRQYWQNQHERGNCRSPLQ